MNLSDRRLHLFGKLAQLFILTGVGLWLFSVVSWQLTKTPVGGVALLNWACGIAAVGLIADLTVRTVKMKRRQREG